MNIQLSDHFTYKRLYRFVLPSILMMVFTSIYGVVDGLFVSNFVGKNAFAAVNLIMPFVMIFGGVGFMFGTGGSALIAKTLGEQEKEKASKYFSMLVEALVITGVLITVISVAAMKPVSLWLGADGAMLENCVLYGRITMLFSVPFMLQFAFQSFCVAAEKPELGLWVTLAAGFSNMLLDGLFVGLFSWGVAGAALATGLSECVGGLIPLIYFLRPNTSPLQFRKTKIKLKPVITACWNGVSEFAQETASSVVGIVYNFQLLRYAGADGVAANGVLMYVQLVFAAIFIGYSIGCGPVISYHYGAQNHSELRNLFKKSNVSMGAIGIAMAFLAILLASGLSKIFVGYDAKLLEMTVHGFKIQALAFLFMGFNVYASAFFTALNNGNVSAAISLLRTFIVKMAAVLIMPLFWKLDGIWWSITAAEAIAFVISILFLAANRKKYHYAGSDFCEKR